MLPLLVTLCSLSCTQACFSADVMTLEGTVFVGWGLLAGRQSYQLMISLTFFSEDGDWSRTRVDIVKITSAAQENTNSLWFCWKTSHSHKANSSRTKRHSNEFYQNSEHNLNIITIQHTQWECECLCETHPGRCCSSWHWNLEGAGPAGWSDIQTSTTLCFSPVCWQSPSQPCYPTAGSRVWRKFWMKWGKFN